MISKGIKTPILLLCNWRCPQYWAGFGLFLAVEQTVDLVLSWLPLYTAAKLGALVWLAGRGAGLHLLLDTATHRQPLSWMLADRV